ncbi:hypothetical protein RB195_020317 [Necator americanus]|uniref:Transthyretin-like family protein n=1 Tax=Necator americanus TaxID=51031 RepID=A0ABR1CK24_NECAM
MYSRRCKENIRGFDDERGFKIAPSPYRYLLLNTDDRSDRIPEKFVRSIKRLNRRKSSAAPTPVECKYFTFGHETGSVISCEEQLSMAPEVVLAPSTRPLVGLECANDVVTFSSSGAKLQHVVKLVSELASSHAVLLRPGKCKHTIMRSIHAFLLFVPSCVGLLGIGREQSVAVTGRLICNGMPASGVKVKLYDKELTVDSKMAESQTNYNGIFMLSGRKREITNIDPKVNIYHKCNYNGFCYKKLGIRIPSNYITDGSSPRSTYDIGTINLNNKFSGESIDCIN